MPGIKLPAVFGALRAPRYRRYFMGQAVSILGTWVQTVAMSWLVYRLTGSAALLGVTAFMAQAPQLLVSPLAGLLIDRFDRRRLFLTVQALMIAQAAGLATLTALDLASPALLVTLAGLFGLLNSIDTPLRQTMLGRLVDDPALLRNAIALNASLFNSARFVGPPLAGAILTATSESWCFAINAVSFLGVALAVWRLPPSPPAPTRAGLAEAFREGFDFARGHVTVRGLLGGLAMLNLTGSAYVVLMPVLAKESFGGDAATLGLLLGASGAGALSATMLVATRRGLPQTLSLILAGWGMSAAGLFALAFAPGLWAAMAAAFCLGVGVSSVNVSTNAVLQSVTPDRIRGRVISYFTALRFGMDALGGLAAGWGAAAAGVQGVLAVDASLVLLGAGWVTWRLGDVRRAALER